MVLATAASVIGVAGSHSRGATATVALTATQIGVTPRFLGYNMGHYMPGSNTSAWLNYTGLNAFRFWGAANYYEPSDDRAPFGDGVTDLAGFDNRKNLLRADLRANPASTTYVDWNAFATRFAITQTGTNKVTLDHPLSELQKMGADVLMQINRTEASFPMADWGGKWEQWQHYYAMAFYCGKNYDVQRYQMYNEPDLDGISIDNWVQRMQLASDAIKSAIEDVNAVTGKKLAWSVYAPVAADQDGTIDTWGKAALNANRTDYAGRPTTYDLFDTYDVHRYSNTGHAADQVLFDSRIPGYNPSGQNLPVTYSEFNRYGTSTLGGRTDSLDTPQLAAEFASIFPGAMSQDVKGMYAFKFNQTVMSNGRQQKTGFHYVNNSGTYDTTGSTRAAEAMRLAIKAFKGERPRLGQTVSADSSYFGAASLDPSRGNYYFYSVNTLSGDSRTVTLNLAGWNVPVGQVVSYQEVSNASFAAARPQQFMTVPAASAPGVQNVSFTQPASSTWLVTVPSLPQAQVDLAPTADAQVSHATPTTNFGLLTSAKVDRSAATADDDAAYLKFNLGGNDKAKVGRAFLNVTGMNSTDAEPVHVYGITNDAWTETGITWDTAPNLGSGVADARLTGVGSTAFPVGQIAYSAAQQEWGIDVTDFVRKHPDADLSFVLVREQRYESDPSHPADSDVSRVVIQTREAVTAADHPRLSLYLTAQPRYYWNTNFDGSFSSAASWDAGAAPNAVGAVAVLGDFVTSPHNVNLSSTATVGTLSFDNLNGYTLTGNATLTMNAGAATTANVNVFKGSHTINAPMTLTSGTAINTDAGATLTISKPLSGFGALTKTGPGTLVFTAGSPAYAAAATLSAGTATLAGADAAGNSGLGSGPITIAPGATLNVATATNNLGTIDGGGAVTVAAGATLSAARLRLGPVTINGTARVRDDGSTAATSSITSLTLGAGATLDLRNNSLTLGQAVGSWNGSAYSGVLGLVAGKRIQTTSSDAAGSRPLTALAVAAASDIGAAGTWRGVSVSGSTALVMYTYAGDADLNGRLDGDDYFRIDANVGTASPSWTRGDFNYDGKVNGDDYFVLDGNLSRAAQTPLPGAAVPAALEAIAAPEPAATSAALLALFASGAARRRRHA